MQETGAYEHEHVSYQSVEQWEALSLAELDEAYALIPTQRQGYYRAVLEREAGKAGAVTDAEELEVARALLARFAADALVPVGARWAKPPARVKAAAMTGEALVAPEDVFVTKRTPINPLIVAGIAVSLFACLMVMLFAASQGGDDAPPIAISNLRYTLTPTPIALEEQDTIIRDGDRDSSRTLAYPVGLHVYPPGEAQPRVFVVQRRRVDFSEWAYDPNPDTASYLLGMSVRRVVGIPFSEENAALFGRIEEGAIFHLILNTGAIIEYHFERKTELRRSDTAAFRQIAPGLALVLMGELDDDGAPTATRLLVTARYEAEQELTRGSFLSTDTDSALLLPSPTPIIPTATPIPARDLLYVELVSAATSPDGYLVTELRLYNGQSETVRLYPEEIQITFGHNPNPPGPWQAAAGHAEIAILPGQAIDLGLVWDWNGERYANLDVGTYRFAIQITQ